MSDTSLTTTEKMAAIDQIHDLVKDYFGDIGPNHSLGVESGVIEILAQGDKALRAQASENRIQLEERSIELYKTGYTLGMLLGETYQLGTLQLVEEKNS
ncbi:MAG: hypothetical protein M3Q14_00520 [bacterium]|nr:hypothetical protein [bacterium]